VSRLPIRLRLTLIFVLVMGVVFAAVGAFVYFRTKSNIDDSIAASLRSRQAALRAYAAALPPGAPSSIPPGERFAQLLTPDGRVIESRPEGARARLTPAQARRAARAPAFSELHERERYLAGPARVDGRPAVALAATSLAEHERALESLAGALLIGGPLALLVAGALGYATAAGALRPVELMRRRAATISRADASAELPVPDVDDEVRRLSLTLNEMLERLARSADAERRFVANASHELRTPLAALQAELELADRPGTSPEEVRAALTRVREDAARLVALSQDLLEISAADAGRAGPRAEVVVDDVLDRVAGGARHRAGELGRTLQVQHSGLSVHGDELALQRLMTNLVDNALVHGRGDVVLGATREEEAHRIALWVRDGGRVAAEVREIAFDRFARGRDTAGRPGAGLGLSLVRAIAEQHGGEAALEDLDGAGVRAVVRLPA
jgi:two-component system, OmpR family, sensor kinase